MVCILSTFDDKEWMWNPFVHTINLHKTPASDNNTEGIWAWEWLIEQRGPLSSTSFQLVPVLVSCEEQSSCTALILTGKRCEHKCSAAAAPAAAGQRTTCQKCRVTLRAATWPRNAVSHWTTLYDFPLAACGQLALRKCMLRYSMEGAMQWWNVIKYIYSSATHKHAFEVLFPFYVTLDSHCTDLNLKQFQKSKCIIHINAAVILIHKNHRTTSTLTGNILLHLYNTCKYLRKYVWCGIVDNLVLVLLLK